MTIREPLTAKGRTYYAEYDTSRPCWTLYRDQWYLDRIPSWTRSECKRFPRLAAKAAQLRLKELLAQGAVSG